MGLGVLLALVFAVALAGCSGDDTTIIAAPVATVGSLNVNVSPAPATVVVTGPDGFTQNFTGNQLLIELEPGQYEATASAPGFVTEASSINVVVGQTSQLALILQATQNLTEAPRAVYRDGTGTLVALNTEAAQLGEFVFYAWLEDKPLGILPANITANPLANPGRPLTIEQMETAPSSALYP